MGLHHYSISYNTTFNKRDPASMDRYMILDEKLAIITKYKSDVLFYITIMMKHFRDMLL